MLSQNHLLLKCFYYLFMIMICFLQTSYGKQSPYNCSPSACGHIRNISYPFRLRDDPKDCGNPDFELSCHNNTTSIYFKSQKYLVQAINYDNNTIRLADPTTKYFGYHFDHHYSAPERTWTITFLSCAYPASDSALLVDISQDCFNQSGNYTRHTYIKFGYFGEPYVMDIKCRIDLVTLSSLPVKDENNVSLSEIHSSLLYGVELGFFAWELISCPIECSCSLPVHIMSSICWCQQFFRASV
ncbi:hypothetical protein CDL12_00156 [Handroanthus impetiginosus]|uniref:Wall-associated receptor kinase galacturonan-binding domain-containing protein n=1 Tax=Handroanthus impetiginosus TaxID=429701 RepID=A0A2G9IBG8_9LAMI|nr:hypothetical protein CDL12_00156 [Handroanthus impetiginosus]